MGSKASIVFFIFTSLTITASAVSALEVRNRDYRQTVYRFENFNCQECTSRIKAEILQNDHTARVVLDSKLKKLLIIHHKSIGIKQLDTIVANHGILTNAVTRNNYKPDNQSLLLMNPNTSVWPQRYCGATKVAWKSLLRKYLH